MAFFTEESLDFWQGLARDNLKAYFDANRKTYETHLKTPYQELAAALVAGLQADQPEYQLDPKKATYRINRDIRFSKDKSPYKTELGITIGHISQTAEFTLSDRSHLDYQVLVGRNILQDMMVVDVSRKNIAPYQLPDGPGIVP